MISETSGVVAIMSAVFLATVIAEVLFSYIYDLDVPCGYLTYFQRLSQSKVSPNPSWKIIAPFSLNTHLLFSVL